MASAANADVKKDEGRSDAAATLAHSARAWPRALRPNRDFKPYHQPVKPQPSAGMFLRTGVAADDGEAMNNFYDKFAQNCRSANHPREKNHRG
ncbi:MAG TPA: hypothetical protein VJ750_11480 [Rhizomicrobium sp.]|nr:hypothetical protein [Rhizomicrobium sp.]